MTNTTADIEAIVQQHQNGLRRYLMVLGCDEESANDLAQEAFLILWRNRPKLGEGSSTSAWLRHCAFNLLRDSRRRESRRALLRREAAEMLWSRYRLDERPNAWGDALLECLELVPPPMLKVLDMSYREGLSGKEIAHITGRSEGDVWTLLHRARAKLRTCITRRLDHDR